MTLCLAQMVIFVCSVEGLECATQTPDVLAVAHIVIALIASFALADLVALLLHFSHLQHQADRSLSFYLPAMELACFVTFCLPVTGRPDGDVVSMIGTPVVTGCRPTAVLPGTH